MRLPLACLLLAVPPFSRTRRHPLTKSPPVSRPRRKTSALKPPCWIRFSGAVVVSVGFNDLNCLADVPAKELLGSCYHKDLEPFMARGRELSEKATRARSATKSAGRMSTRGASRCRAKHACCTC